MKRKAETDGDVKSAKKSKKEKEHSSSSSHKHKNKDKKKDKHKDKDERRHKDTKPNKVSPDKTTSTPITDIKLSTQENSSESSLDSKQTKTGKEELSIDKTVTKPKVTEEQAKRDKPDEGIKLKIDKNSPKKFHISNFMLGSSEKKEKSHKKKHKEKDKERTDKSVKKPSSSSSASSKVSSHSGKSISSALYGNQSLELKHSNPDEQKHKKPPVKLERKISRQKSEAEELLYHHVEKTTKDSIKEPYMPEYHDIKRYISKDISGEFKHLLHIEVHPNGGGLVLHSYQDEVDALPADRQKAFVNEYMKLAFREDENQCAYFIMAIVHDSAKPMPDLIDYLGEKHPNMTTKMGGLGKSDIETMLMSEVKEKIYNSYDSGTYRAGPLQQLSLVGLAQEEVGVAK